MKEHATSKMMEEHWALKASQKQALRNCKRTQMMEYFKEELFQKKALQAKKARDFLDWHPAFSASPNGELTGNLCFGIEPVCRRGEWESSKKILSIMKGDKKRHWEKFKDEFKKEELKLYKIYDDPKIINMEKNFLRINKTYKEVYGEEWKFDHIIYWYETTFNVFKGKINTKDWVDAHCWENYESFYGQQRTFEDMLINMNVKAKKYFGNFKIYDKKLMSKKEIENHEKEKSFYFIPCKNKKGFSEMKNNKKYYEICNGLYNLRWLRWFVDTEYCQKQWKNEFDWVKNMDLYPYS